MKIDLRFEESKQGISKFQVNILLVLKLGLDVCLIGEKMLPFNFTGESFLPTSFLTKNKLRKCLVHMYFPWKLNQQHIQRLLKFNISTIFHILC